MKGKIRFVVIAIFILLVFGFYLTNKKVFADEENTTSATGYEGGDDSNTEEITPDLDIEPTFVEVGKNTLFGEKAGRDIDSLKAFHNTFIGYKSGLRTQKGDRNTFLGSLAGRDNIIGSSNVFIGYQAGFNETGWNKLYIANSKGTPLIYGNFKTGKVGIGTTTPRGKLTVGNSTTNNGTPGILIADPQTRIELEETDATANNKRWDILADQESLVGRVVDDADTVASQWLRVHRTGVTVDSVTFLNGDVGIGTEFPSEKLTVNGKIESTSGGIKFPDGTLQTTALNITSNLNPLFPDGFFQGTPKNIVVTNTSSYTVTTGKTLYIISMFSSGGSFLQIDGIDFYGDTLKPTESGARPLNMPLVVPSDSTIGSRNNPFSITGIEVDAGVDIKNIVVTTTSKYTVPIGKTLYILTMQPYGGDAMLVLGEGAEANVYYYTPNPLNLPLVVLSGTTMSSTRSSSSIAITGYER